nr:hypothetical protein [uncultured archaeon]
MDWKELFPRLSGEEVFIRLELPGVREEPLPRLESVRREIEEWRG